MALFKTLGVVVRRRDLGEADRLLTLFTRRFGKVRAVAKGCRRPRSRMAGHLEPLNVAEFLLWSRGRPRGGHLSPGRGLALVRGAELVESHPVLEKDFRVFVAAQAAAEFLDRSLEEDEPQTGLFDLLTRFLRSLARPDHAESSLLAFMVRAAEVLGYAVSLDRCAGCRSRMDGSGAAWLEYTRGGLLCGECARAGRTGEELGREVVGALRLAAAHPPRASGPGAAAAAVRALDRLLSFHQDRRPLNAGRLLPAAATA